MVKGGFIVASGKPLKGGGGAIWNPKKVRPPYLKTWIRHCMASGNSPVGTHHPSGQIVGSIPWRTSQYVYNIYGNAFGGVRCT